MTNSRNSREVVNVGTYPLTYPAVLIDASDVMWSNIAGLSQKGIATISVPCWET